MTAIVGILNRNGVAFAADSAATHTLSEDKKKITNHANKVFELSKYHPVGVAICGGLSFMGVPWEDIFKLYRINLDTKSYDHVDDYVHDFMNYVRRQILPRFVSEQKEYLGILCAGLRDEVLNFAIKTLVESGKAKDSISSVDTFPLMINKLQEFIAVYQRDVMFNGKDFEGYDFEGFIKYAQDSIDIVLKDTKGDKHCPKEYSTIFSEALYYILISRVHVYLPTSEIVFWGYGEDELFPSCHSILISAAFDGRIKWTDSCMRSITNATNSSAWILPFAQTDVANTVVRGIDQTLREEYNKKVSEVFELFKTDLAKKLETEGAPEEFKNALLKYDIAPYLNIMIKDMGKYIQDNYINKLMETVSYLMKEDLADMAESLVRMTCLKRHFTTDDETVGGPVDVSVITKGDGFVWIKRKHYFSPDINHHYFER